MSMYSPIIDSFKEILGRIIDGSDLFSITLGDLSKFQAIRTLLDKLTFLNTIYLNHEAMAYINFHIGN